MKRTSLFFNFFVVVGLFSCTAPVKTMTTPPVPAKEMKAEFPKTDSLLAGLLAQQPQYFDSILQNPDRYRVQIIYTQIDRLTGNHPVFTHHYFNLDPHQYYYPASTVKLPVAALALQRLNELKVQGLDKETSFITEAAHPGQTAVFNDPTTADGRPTIAQYIKKILLVSDNDAYNRLYEFLGQAYINNALHGMGYDSAQIVHRLEVAMNEEQHRHTNPVKFYNGAGDLVYEQPLVKSAMPYQARHTLLGKGFLRNGQLVNEPFDFSKKNRLALPDLHAILQSLIFPEDVEGKRRFNLTVADYRFLHRHMSMLPGESASPAYDSTYVDGYVKFLLHGGEGNMDDKSVRIFNKVGDAYGFLTDAAYVVDFSNQVEFMLSATIFCNSDEIFNDDKYDYKNIGFPFMKNLGQVIYQHELKRTRKNKPDLSAFKFDYAE